MSKKSSKKKTEKKKQSFQTWMVKLLLAFMIFTMLFSTASYYWM